MFCQKMERILLGETELKELVEKLDREKIIHGTSGVGEIQWQFNP